jgi:hypothetical protein
VVATRSGSGLEHSHRDAKTSGMPSACTTSASKNSFRIWQSWAHIESTCPLAEVKMSAGSFKLRREAATSVINRADCARSITAIGRPPIISTGTSNPPDVSGTKESLAFHTIGSRLFEQFAREIASRVWRGHLHRLLSLRRAPPKGASAEPD